jgi:hypothetical protein
MYRTKFRNQSESFRREPEAWGPESDLATLGSETPTTKSMEVPDEHGGAKLFERCGLSSLEERGQFRFVHGLPATNLISAI